MEIIEYTHEESMIEEYIILLKKLYTNQDINYNIMNIKRMLSKDNPFYKYGKIRSIIIKENKQVVGHCSAIIDERNKDVGLIGFYDTMEDEKIANLLLDNSINWLKNNNCNRIRGPVNLTIWNDYRFVTKEVREHDLFDPLNKKYLTFPEDNIPMQKYLD